MSVASDPDDFSTSWSDLYPAAHLTADETAQWLGWIINDEYTGVNDTMRAVAARLAFTISDDTPRQSLLGSIGVGLPELDALDRLVRLGWTDEDGFPIAIPGGSVWR